MKKRLVIVVLGLLIVGGILAGTKFLQIRRMTAAGQQAAPPPATVNAAEAKTDSWLTQLTAVGSLKAVQGVTVAAELPGKVVKIAFESGETVREGDLLVQQDVSSEQAQLPGAEAEVTLAASNLRRARQLFAEKFISRAEYDAAIAAHRQAVAAAENIRSVIAKKTVRAPFAGRLGIRQVDLGQALAEGGPVVSLQTLAPIYVDFYLPQQQLPHLEPGLDVRVTSDALPGEAEAGTISAVNPEVDPATRNIRVRATLANHRQRLRPGMFATVAVVLPGRREVVAIPATAVLYAPYGNSVFVIEAGESGLRVRQQFVHLGAKRGDFVAVDEGLQAGQRVVSTGVFKLRNGQAVVVDDSVEPEFRLQPKPGEG